MTDDTPARRDYWIAEANARGQQIQELRLWLARAVHGPLAPDELESVRILLERTAK